jgi:hypothetical protein
MAVVDTQVARVVNRRCRDLIEPAEPWRQVTKSRAARRSLEDVMATALVLKELEGLSDRQAADALRCDIRWKVATSLWPILESGLFNAVPGLEGYL